MGADADRRGQVPAGVVRVRLQEEGAAVSAEMIAYEFTRFNADQMTRRADDFYRLMASRRSVRAFSPRPVPRRLIETAILTASSAPSGAHRQPWTFVVVGDGDIKSRIRLAAEREERENYEGGRLPSHWRDALEPLGTTSSKPYLEMVPWIVALFEQRYTITPSGDTKKNFYVKESVGIAAGLFVAALHNMGLATLTHTPSPMAFLTRLLDRPENERPFALFPIGFPAPECQVPQLTRKSLPEVMVRFPEGADSDSDPA